MKFTVVDSSGLIEHHDTDAGTVRCEVGRASRVQPGCSAAAADQTVTIHHFGDSALAERVIRLRRSIEDAHRAGRAALADEKDLRATVALQRVRFRLRMRYGARDAYGPADDRGTDVYDHYMRLGEAPSYWLAFQLDRYRAETGKRHIVAWAAVA